MEILYILPGLIIGLIIGWLYAAKRQSSIKTGFEQKINQLEIDSAILQERILNLQKEKDANYFDLTEERKKTEELLTQLATAKTDQKNLNEKIETNAKQLEILHQKFTLEFENVATKILKINSAEFNEVSEKKIGTILNPLKEKIESFEKQVNETYIKGLKDQSDLHSEIKKIADLSQKMSIEANNLTHALKGDTKKQGNWGELILEKVLERSGLTKGVEFDTQVNSRGMEGEILKPDVIVFLPENKHIVIDSKVSLLSYEEFINSDQPDEKEKHLKSHVQSLRAHIKGLGEKNYSMITGLDTPDFVLLFLPIESAFGIALQADTELFSFAWEKKIVLVSPTTLLATLKTVEAIWKHEKQTKNALEIARQSGALYDKFEGFLKDLEKIGNGIQVLDKTYQDAHKKLSTGHGNLISHVEKLKKLGAKTTKSISDKYLITDEYLIEETEI